jgi:GT2 family glycosyltransferase
MMPLIDVLIPTYQRPAALAVTLTSLLLQTFQDFRVFISDQSEENGVLESGEARAVIGILRSHGIEVTVLKNLPRRGMAHQRQFLLDQAVARYALFLDDDIIMENYVMENMVRAIQEEGCGLVGCALIGLTHIDDLRPHQQQIEFWEGPVEPEQVRPGTPEWERHQLHNAANIFHVARQLNLHPLHPRKYKIAWVGGCVLYETAKLFSVGGFSFWKDLPDVHAGEDVLAQLRVMDMYGGCGLIPSGVYHQQLPTTIPDRPVDAPKYLEIEVNKNESETT